TPDQQRDRPDERQYPSFHGLSSLSHRQMAAPGYWTQPTGSPTAAYRKGVKVVRVKSTSEGRRESTARWKEQQMDRRQFLGGALAGTAALPGALAAAPANTTHTASQQTRLKAG